MKGVQVANATETSDVNNKYILPRKKQKPEKKRKTVAASLVMVCAPVMGLRVPSCGRFSCGLLIALAQSARTFARALVATPLLKNGKTTKED